MQREAHIMFSGPSFTPCPRLHAWSKRKKVPNRHFHQSQIDGYLKWFRLILKLLSLQTQGMTYIRGHLRSQESLKSILNIFSWINRYIWLFCALDLETSTEMKNCMQVNQRVLLRATFIRKGVWQNWALGEADKWCSCSWSILRASKDGIAPKSYHVRQEFWPYSPRIHFSLGKLPMRGITWLSS